MTPSTKLRSIHVHPRTGTGSRGIPEVRPGTLAEEDVALVPMFTQHYSEGLHEAPTVGPTTSAREESRWIRRRGREVRISVEEAGGDTVDVEGPNDDEDGLGRRRQDAVLKKRRLLGGQDFDGVFDCLGEDVVPGVDKDGANVGEVEDGDEGREKREEVRR